MEQILKRQYVFGPVASRRLGLSLGVDLVVPKTCPLDCVYCEARRTTNLTMERRPYVPVEQVLAELDATLAEHPKLDYITFSGSGEPTLNSDLGRVIEHLKTHAPQYKICLLTNGLLLGDPEVRREIAPVDLVIPSLDASNEQEFQAVNRPVPEMSFERFVGALTDFVRTAKQTVHLELFIVPGVNDSDASIARFVSLIAAMRPALVQLNTLDRPGTEADLKPSTPENTRRFIRAIEPVAPVEAVGVFRYRTPSGGPRECCEPERRILNLILRRPATVPDMATALDMPESAVQKHLDDLFAAGRVTIEKQARGLFYRAE